MLRVIKTIISFFLDFIETIVTALVIFVIIYLFLFQPHQVKGNSMYSSFENGEYLLTNKVVYRFKEPKRGDVVVFKAPPQQKYDYIKRIIGLSGETISLKKGKIYINNSLLNETFYLPENTNTQGSHFLADEGEVNIPENQYFVIGDNRPHSSDSRDWGYISKEDLVGKAWLRYWPLAKFGFIPTIAS